MSVKHSTSRLFFVLLKQVKLGIQAPKRSYVFIAGPQDDRPLTRRVINSVIEGCLAACSILGRAWSSGFDDERI